MKGKKNGRNITKHHVIPQSKGGGNGNNVILITHKRHEAYNTLYGGDIMPEDFLIRFINEFFYPNQPEIRKEKMQKIITRLIALQ